MNDLEQMAIERLKAASDMSLMAYQQPLVICISGGKDSGVITELAIRSGIPCEFLHSHTTADAPETVRFVRSEFKRLGRKGLQMHREYAGLQGAEGVHVEFDSAKTYATYPACAVLLLHPEGNRWRRAVHLYRRSVGGIYIKEKQPWNL